MRVVLITLDTLRWDSFGGAEGRPSTMPGLRQWAERATVFERCFAASSSTQPTHASLFTGLHPWEHGIDRNGQQLAPRHSTVAERLKEAGFSTAAVVASFPLSSRFGFDQGFDRFDDRFVDGELTPTWVRDSRKFSAEGREPSRRSDPFYSLADHVTERALALLELAPSDAEPRRDFFWFHYFDPHDPYGDSGNSGDEETVGPGRALRLAAEGSDPGRVAEAVAEAKRLYDRDVTSLDRSLARVLAWLERDAATTDTHVMILSDHGESFGEGNSMAHGRRLIASQLHVPCLIRSPRVPTGARTDIVGSVDLATTLLALVGVTSDSFAGRNLTLATDDDAEALGMRRAYEKPFRDPRLDGSVEVLEGLLFYRVGARGEIARGHAREPTLSADLQARFAGFEERLARNAEEKLSAPDVDAKLRALGYVE